MEKLEDLKNELWKERNDFKFDDKGVDEAIKHALGDFTFRTTKKKIKEKFGVNEMFKALAKEDKEIDENKRTKSFVCQFKKYFKDIPKKKEEFDKWHKEICNVFLESLKDVYEELSYGKAQKVVNMTFKYAYCLPGAEKKEKYFKHCHMPLDSFTLEWFKRKIVKDNTVKIREGKRNQVGLIPNWSNIRSKEKNEMQFEGKIPYYYEEIIHAIREYLARVDGNDYLKKGDTLLKSEFYIWKYIQFEQAAETLWNFFAKWDDPNGMLNKKESEEFKNRNINDKLNYLHEKFSDVEKYKV